jgi:hypothetical protein
MPKLRRYSEEQIISVLKEIDSGAHKCPLKYAFLESRVHVLIAGESLESGDLHLRLIGLTCPP